VALRRGILKSFVEGNVISERDLFIRLSLIKDREHYQCCENSAFRESRRVVGCHHLTMSENLFHLFEKGQLDCISRQNDLLNF